MAVTIEAVMRHCNNFFVKAWMDGEFTVTDGQLTDEAVLSSARFYAIEGSRFCDGVYGEGIPNDGNETFTGRVWLLNPPSDFLMLCKKASEYDEAVPANAPVSESFGAYSYSRPTGSNGAPVSWKDALKSELARYWKPFTEVHI